MNRRILVACAALSTISFASGCGEDGPFSLTITHVNEHGPQRNAVIAISDPQIYTRERMLNDREDEINFLKEELKAINTKNFTPRLKRDLDELVEIVGALSVKFNPVAGANIEQASQIADLKNDIEIERLQNLLKDVKKNNTPADAGAVTDSSATAASTSTDTLATQSLSDLTTSLAGLLKSLEDAQTARNGKLGRPDLRANSVTEATPSEEFRDKMAYRNEIVSALEQAQLDDRHDLNGNALYRLQLKATVFPGQVKDKYGVARLTILPPLFDDDAAVSRLYLDWLAYVAAQLNPAPSSSGEGSEPADSMIVDRYRLLGEATGIYVAKPIPYSKEAAAAAANLAESTKDPAAKDAYTALEGQLDSGSSAGQILVPIPPSILPSTVVDIMNSAKTNQFISLFNNAAKAIAEYGSGWDSKKPYLRWSKDDGGRCAQLVVTTPAADGTSAYAPFANLDAASSASDTERTTALKAALDSSGNGLDTVSLQQQIAANAANKDDIEKQRVVAITVAIVLARNIHNLTPAYSLALQRTIATLERARQTSAVKQLRSFAKTLDDVSGPADVLLMKLQQALVTSIKGKLQSADRAGTADIYDDLPAGASEAQVKELLDHMSEASAESAESSKLLHDIEDKVPCLSVPSIAGRIYVPEAFYRSVTATKDSHYASLTGRPYAGSTYAYSTAPAELAQRVSSVASATQALDLMASVSAIIPSAGVGLAGSGQVQQIASGHVDAIESAPLIVGFSNSGSANVETNQFGAEDADPSFGWVFGPKVIVDAEHSQLDLSQVLVEQPVTADISVPGWWVGMRLRVETAWAANFENGVLAGAAFNGQSAPSRQPTNRVADYVVDVPLQTNPATFEQLTEYIANRTWGLQYKEPTITGVEPNKVVACDGVHVLISGTDLWRGRQVYLNGIPAKSTQIMPDMQGLDAQFDLSAAEAGPAKLVVWTQLGQPQPASVEIAASQSCKKASTAGLTAAAKVSGPPVIVAGDTTILTVSDAAKFGTYKVILLSGRGADLKLSVTDVDHPEAKTFQIKWPDAATFKSAFKGSPQDGEQFQAELRHADDDDASVLSSIKPLYFFTKAVSSLLPDSKYTVANSTDYLIDIALPKNFVAAFGTDVKAEVSGFQDDKNTDQKTDQVTPIFAADHLQLKFSAPANWKPKVADTLTIAVKVAGKSMSVTAKKGP